MNEMIINRASKKVVESSGLYMQERDNIIRSYMYLLEKYADTNEGYEPVYKILEEVCSIYEAKLHSLKDRILKLSSDELHRASKNLLIQSLDVYMLIQRYGNFEVVKKDISNTDFNIRYIPFKDCISEVKDIVDKLTLLVKSYEMENSILKKIGSEKMLSCVNSYLKEKGLEELDIRENILEICISQYVPNDLTAEQKMYIDEGVLL